MFAKVADQLDQAMFIALQIGVTQSFSANAVVERSFCRLHKLWQIIAAGPFVGRTARIDHDPLRSFRQHPRVSSRLQSLTNTTAE